MDMNNCNSSDAPLRGRPKKPKTGDEKESPPATGRDILNLFEGAAGTAGAAEPDQDADAAAETCADAKTPAQPRADPSAWMSKLDGTAKAKESTPSCTPNSVIDKLFESSFASRDPGVGDSRPFAHAGPTQSRARAASKGAAVEPAARQGLFSFDSPPKSNRPQQPDLAQRPKAAPRSKLEELLAKAKATSQMFSGDRAGDYSVNFNMMNRDQVFDTANDEHALFLYSSQTSGNFQPRNEVNLEARDPSARQHGAERASGLQDQAIRTGMLPAASNGGYRSGAVNSQGAYAYPSSAGAELFSAASSAARAAASSGRSPSDLERQRGYAPRGGGDADEPNRQSAPYGGQGYTPRGPQRDVDHLLSMLKNKDAQQRQALRFGGEEAEARRINIMGEDPSAGSGVRWSTGGQSANCFSNMGHLYRQPQELSGASLFYSTRKKRRSNPSSWSTSSLKQEHGYSIPPSQFSSLEFIKGINGPSTAQGTQARQPEKSRNNHILPMILESNKILVDEYAVVVQSFKQNVAQLDFNNVTVCQLKSLMKEYGLSHGGKKNELIAQAKEVLRKIDALGQPLPKVPQAQPEHKQAEPETIDFQKYFF
ncbi:hypothetical protein PAPHI01_2505 [Pancytospora philotis]|nr:hypothetical protein PAPHI01_2505 [Pancytospora philotis]